MMMFSAKERNIVLLEYLVQQIKDESRDWDIQIHNKAFELQVRMEEIANEHLDNSLYSEPLIPVVNSSEPPLEASMPKQVIQVKLVLGTIAWTTPDLKHWNISGSGKLLPKEPAHFIIEGLTSPSLNDFGSYDDKGVWTPKSNREIFDRIVKLNGG